MRTSIPLLVLVLFASSAFAQNRAVVLESAPILLVPEPGRQPCGWPLRGASSLS
jgi:hypothetical protein